MKPFIIGLGRAGCKIASIFFERESLKVEYNGVLLDTDKNLLDSFNYRNKMLLGLRLVDGNGTGKDLRLGREILDSERYNIVEYIDSVKTQMDTIFVISAMGGGTGGAADVLMDELKKSYTEKVYYIGILPSEEDLEKALVNFSESFKRIVKKSDAIFPADNELLKERMKLIGQLNFINERIYNYFNSIFEVGEYKTPDELGGNIINSTDVINTLTGVSSVGQSGHEIKSKSQFGIFKKSSKEDKPDLVVSLTEAAVEKMLLKFDYKEAQKALVVVSGPKRYLDFLGSIPARLWVEKNIEGVLVRGGDVPVGDKKQLEVTLVLSGIKKSERIRYLYQLGKVTKNKSEYSEEFSRVFERFKTLKGKFKDFDGDMESLYDQMRELAGGKRPKE